MEKRGQVTIFIIVALVIIAVAILVFMFRPVIENFISGEAKTPSTFLQNCLEEDLKKNVNNIANQGGSFNPKFSYNYLGTNVEYLCYTNEYYKTCVVQQPLLVKHIVSEIEREIEEKVNECFNSMKEKFDGDGYDVSVSGSGIKIELLPKRIILRFNQEVTLGKDGSKTYKNLEIVLNNNLYELVSIADSIIEWESQLGEAETTAYMNYYHDLKVEKKEQSDGTKIYILTDRNTGDVFQFASRSLVWPPGYGL